MESLNFHHLLKENFSENKTGETVTEKSSLGVIFLIHLIVLGVGTL